MKQKAIKYTIILLLVPLMISLMIAIITDNKGINYNEPDGYNGLDAPEYGTVTLNEEIKKSNTYIYITIFTFVAISGGILVYIKQKRGI